MVKDTTVEVLGIAKPAAGLIPYVGGVVKGGIEVAQEVNDQTKLVPSRTLYRGLNIKSLEKIADEIARKISFAYIEQIQLLSEEGATIFAQCGVLRVVAAILNGSIQNTENFPIDVLRAIRFIPVDQNRKTILGLIEIPFANRKLDPYDKKNPTELTEDKLYRKCGIAYEFNGLKNYYSSDKANKDGTFAKEIGYMWVSKEEWSLYFRKYVTKDPSRLGPDNLQEAKPIKPIAANKKQILKFEPKNNIITDLEVQIALLNQQVKALENGGVIEFRHIPQEILNQVRGLLATLIEKKYKFHSIRIGKQLTLRLLDENIEDKKAIYELLKNSLCDTMKVFSDHEVKKTGLVFQLLSADGAKKLKCFLRNCGLICKKQ